MSTPLATLAEYHAMRERYGKLEALAKGAHSPDPTVAREATVAATKAAELLDKLIDVERDHPAIKADLARVMRALDGSSGFGGPGGFGGAQGNPQGASQGTSQGTSIFDRVAARVVDVVASRADEFVGDTVKAFTGEAVPQLTPGDFVVALKAGDAQVAVLTVAVRRADMRTRRAREVVLDAVDVELAQVSRA